MRAFGVSGPMSGTIVPQPDSQLKNSVDWREQVGSEAVCAAWENLAGAIVQEFVYESWYSHLTPDTQFPAEIRALLNSAFGRLSQRANRVDIRKVVSEIIELFMEHLDLFRDTREELISQGEWSRAENEMDQLEFSPEIDKMIRDNLLATGNLHPALENGHYYVLRDISEGVVYHLVDKYFHSRLASRAVVRELLAGCVFRPFIRFCSPYHWTKRLLALLRRAQTRQNEIVRSQSKEDALYGVWCMASKIRETIEKEQAKVPVMDHDSQDDDDDDDDDESMITPRSVENRVTFEDHHCVNSSSPVREPIILDPDSMERRDHLMARIVNAELNTDGARDFVVYKIRVGDALKEWTICRRYRQFEVLHRQLRQISSYDCQLPGKRFFFHSPNVEFIEQRRCALDDYLQSVLQNPVLKASDDLWEFLRQDSRRFEISTEKSKSKMRHAMSSKVLVATEMVGRGVYEATLDSSYQIKKHAKTGVDNMIEGMKTLSQGKKKATKNSMEKLRIMQDRKNVNEGSLDTSPGLSTSTSTTDNTPDIEENDSDQGVKNSTVSIQTPIYDMLDCIFQLQTRGFFRRQVFSVGRQMLSLVLGDAVEDYLSESLDFLRQESTISQLIHRLQILLWPGGVWMRRNIPQPDEMPLPSVENYVEPLGEPLEDKDEVRRSMQEALTVGMPFPLARLVGKLAYYDGSRDIMQLLQSRTMTLQLGYCTLETLLYHLFPETKPK